jgi:hypothetical protein
MIVSLGQFVSWLRLLAVTVPVVAGAVELGPLATTAPAVRQPGERHEAFGPLVSGEISGTQQWWSLSPLVRDLQDPALGRVHVDVLYPLLTYDRFETEYRWQFFQWFNVAGSQTIADTNHSDTKTRRNFFPFIFSQKSASGTNDYLAVVPFYGRMENHFFRDEVRFVALPLWVTTKKAGVETINVPAPFFHLRRGAGVSGWQLWPLAGHETKAIAWKTNLVDELDLIPGHQKSFVLWPFGFAEKTGLGTTNPTTLRTVLPLFASVRSPARDQTTVLWPFFTHTDDRQGRFEEWGTPWPFLGWAQGEGKTARRIWPLWTVETTPSRSREVIGWPFFEHRKITKPALVSDRWRSLYFLYDHNVDQSLTTGARSERRDLWPLFYWQRDFEGRERLQALAPLETLLKNNESIDHLYSPFWSVYRSDKNPARGLASQSLLWNLWRRDVAPNAVTTSSLFGAIRTRQDATGRSWRFFWRPFPTAPSQPSASAPANRSGPTAVWGSKRGDVLAGPRPGLGRPREVAAVPAESAAK